METHRKEGFEIELEPTSDFPTESNFNEYMGKNINRAIKGLSETRKITLKEMQLPRKG